MDRVELLNKINGSAYEIERVRANMFHGKAYVVYTSYIKAIYKTKRGAEGRVKRDTGNSYYDEYLQELVYPSAGEIFEIKESELIEVTNNKMFWYKQLRENFTNIKMYGLKDNLIYQAKQSNVNEEIMTYIKESIEDIENNRGLKVYKEETKIEKEAQAEELEVKTNQETEIKPESNVIIECEVKFNTDKNGIELYFTDKPSEEIRNNIKSTGFRWSKYNKCWFIKDTETTRNYLQELGLLNKDNEQNKKEIKTEDLKEVEEPIIVIDETLAKRSKENMSFDDYKEGSATQEYNTRVEEVAKKINSVKEKVSEEESKRKLDYLLQKFKKDYANWVNKHNSNGANHVSWMISGRGNYNMNKHNKYVAREGKLWDEYNTIMDIDCKINKILNSENIIKSSDKNALDKLRKKLEQEEKQHQEIKDYNKKARKEGKEVYPSYMLSNSNQRIKNIKDRIKQLEKLSQQETKEIEINGIKIIDNVEANRLQIVFNDKPDEDIRKKLKSNGFRWSPSNSAWQRFRSSEAERKAKMIIESIENNEKVAI